MPPSSELSPMNKGDAGLDGYRLSQGKASRTYRDSLRCEGVSRTRRDTC